MHTGTPTSSASIAEVAPVNIGLYTWRVEDDLVYADALVADVFDLCADTARCGLPLESFLESIHTEDVKSVVAAISNALETGNPYCVDYRVYSASGVMQTVRAMGQCFRDGNGRPLEWAGTILTLGSKVVHPNHDADLVEACHCISDCWARWS
jgi:hypothetical protein